MTKWVPTQRRERTEEQIEPFPALPVAPLRIVTESSVTNERAKNTGNSAERAGFEPEQEMRSKYLKLDGIIFLHTPRYRPSSRPFAT
jgi:hypothetical protein